VSVRAAVQALLVTAAVAVCAPQPALAQWEPSGALTVQALVGPRAGPNGRHTLGAGAMVDLWEPVGPFRVGAAVGMAALTSDDASFSRVFMSGGLSMAVVGRWGAFGGDLRLRGGPWAGAVETGLGAGAWVAAGAHIEYAPDVHVALAAGVDLVHFFGHGTMRVVAPGVGLVWTFDAHRMGR
jgi:hypothetical protein